MSAPRRPDLVDPPGEPGALAGFPRRTLPAGGRIFRLHHANLGACWFGSAAIDAPHGNRFDLAAPSGSSYWALRAEAAFLETLARRPARVIPLELIDRYRLTVAHQPRPIEAANTPVKQAWGYGLTGEFHTTTDYRITRRWAAALQRDGFTAVIAIPRHDVTARLRSITLFGPTGEHRPFGWTWESETVPVPAALIDAMAAWGVRCIPIPFEVEVIPPPH